MGCDEDRRACCLARPLMAQSGIHRLPQQGNVLNRSDTETRAMALVPPPPPAAAGPAALAPLLLLIARRGCCGAYNRTRSGLPCDAIGSTARRTSSPRKGSLGPLPPLPPLPRPLPLLPTPLPGLPLEPWEASGPSPALPFLKGLRLLPKVLPRRLPPSKAL